ncbi:MAG: hypothetical protein R6W77_13655 [Trueperaceae bacterium]
MSLPGATRWSACHAAARRGAGVVLVLAVFAVFAFPSVAVRAQSPAGVSATGTHLAVVPLRLTAELGPTLELRLPTGHLSFDLRNGALGSTVATCVIGSGEDALVGGSFAGTPMVAPGGTSYRVDAWPTVAIGGGPALTEFPAPPGTASVVCYKTFVLGVFANVADWQLSAAALPVPGVAPIRAIYVGAAVRDDDPGGLVPLAGDVRATLVQATDAPTSGEVLVVVAVKLGSEPAGTSATLVRYTLMAADADFGTE